MCRKKDMSRTKRPEREKGLLQGSSGQRFHTGLGISLRPYRTRERAKATAEENSRSPDSQCTVDMMSM